MLRTEPSALKGCLELFESREISRFASTFIQIAETLIALFTDLFACCLKKRGVNRLNYGVSVNKGSTINTYS